MTSPPSALERVNCCEDVEPFKEEAYVLYKDSVRTAQ